MRPCIGNCCTATVSAIRSSGRGYEPATLLLYGGTLRYDCNCSVRDSAGRLHAGPRPLDDNARRGGQDAVSRVPASVASCARWVDAPPVGAAAPGPKVAPVAAGDAGWPPAVERVKAAESADGAGRAEVGEWALPEGLTRPSPSGAYRNADETDSRRERWAGPAGPGLAETPRVRSWAPRSHQTANAKHRPVSKHRLALSPAGRFGPTPP